MKKSIFSIIICTYNRPEDLFSCVKSILKNSFSDYQIQIIDQSPTHETKKLIETFTDKRVNYYHFDRPSLSMAHNLGIKHSFAENVIFVDDDCFMSINCLSSYRACLDKYPDVAGFFGSVLPYEPKKHLNKICPALINHKKISFISDPYINYHTILGQGNNMCFRATTIKKVGLFNTLLGPGEIGMNGDDSEYIYRILKNNMLLGTCPNAIVYHNRWKTSKEEAMLHFGYTCGWIAFATASLLQGDIKMIKNINIKLQERFISVVYEHLIHIWYRNSLSTGTSISLFFQEVLFVFRGISIGVILRIKNFKITQSLNLFKDAP